MHEFRWIPGTVKWEDIERRPLYRVGPMPRPPRNRFITHPHFWAGVATVFIGLAVLVVVGSWA